jgi:hypothetical protein
LALIGSFDAAAAPITRLSNSGPELAHDVPESRAELRGDER